MPANRLQQQLEELRNQLAEDPPLTEEERASLYVLTQEIELQLARQAAAAPDATLIDGVNLAVERFEASHPTLAGTLRNIVQSLANMGIWAARRVAAPASCKPVLPDTFKLLLDADGLPLVAPSYCRTSRRLSGAIAAVLR
ncbi:hypothetical protein D3C86_1419090 [compost metagenome]